MNINRYIGLSPMETQRKQALIVDKAVAARKVIKSIFLNNGWNGIEAADGPEALQQYRLISPQVVIIETDLGLGNDDGPTVAKKIIQADPKAVIIMVSSVARKEMIVRSTEAGARGYIVKPINPEKFMTAVKKAVS